MKTTSELKQSGSRSETRTLVVADWKVDPQGVVDAVASRHRSRASSFAVVVPAALHGIDWAGDPYANVPCARQALAAIVEHCDQAGLPVHRAEVGDHDPVGAIIDEVLSQPVDQILVCTLKRRAANNPFDLAHRARRATQLPVYAVAIPAAQDARPRRAWTRLRRGECGMPHRLAGFADVTAPGRP